MPSLPNGLSWVIQEGYMVYWVSINSICNLLLIQILLLYPAILIWFACLLYPFFFILGFVIACVGGGFFLFVLTEYRIYIHTSFVLHLILYTSYVLVFYILISYSHLCNVLHTISINTHLVYTLLYTLHFFKV